MNRNVEFSDVQMQKAQCMQRPEIKMAGQVPSALAYFSRLLPWSPVCCSCDTSLLYIAQRKIDTISQRKIDTISQASKNTPKYIPWFNGANTPDAVGLAAPPENADLKPLGCWL